MPSFSKQVQTFTVKTKLDLDSAFRLTALEAIRIFMRKTPVDTGAMRGSWRIGVDEYDNTYIEAPTGPNSKNSIGTEEAYARATTAVSKITVSSIIHVTNSAPYAYEIEMGKSKEKAPAGVLRPGTLELVGKLDTLLREL